MYRVCGIRNSGGAERPLESKRTGFLDDYTRLECRACQDLFGGRRLLHNHRRTGRQCADKLNLADLHSIGSGDVVFDVRELQLISGVNCGICKIDLLQNLVTDVDGTTGCITLIGQRKQATGDRRVVRAAVVGGLPAGNPPDRLPDGCWTCKEPQPLSRLTRQCWA